MKNRFLICLLLFLVVLNACSSLKEGTNAQLGNTEGESGQSGSTGIEEGAGVSGGSGGVYSVGGEHYKMRNSVGGPFSSEPLRPED